VRIKKCFSLPFAKKTLLRQIIYEVVLWNKDLPAHLRLYFTFFHSLNSLTLAIDKNSLWDELNIQEKELYVKKKKSTCPPSLLNGLREKIG